MSNAKKLGEKKEARNIDQHEKKKAYQPKQPFQTVEGVGTTAWKKLAMAAVGILMEFYSKFNGFNRYDLSLTYREVKNKMSSLLFTRFLWQLIGFGFLDIRRTGRLMRNCSLFGISNRWRKLCEEPENLDVIEKLLKQIELIKRQRGSQKKRMKMWELRNKILKLGRHPKIKHS